MAAWHFGADEVIDQPSCALWLAQHLVRCAAAVLLIAASGGVCSGADLFADREALEKKVNEIVQPFLRTPPTDDTGNDKNTSEGDNASADQEKPREERAWAITVGVVSKDGRHVFGYGRLAADSDQRPDGRTLLEIGSVTKTFTAALLADLAEQGKLKLDDPVRLYLRDGATMPKRGDKEITLLQLATHTSGLPRIPTSIGLRSLVSKNPYKDFGVDDLYATLAGVQIDDAPEKYAYSNLGYAVLGHVLCRQAGCDYEQLVLDRVCKPLGMHDTRITLDEERQKRFAAPYTARGTPAAPWDFDVFAGAGALRSTAEDMLTYLEANMGLRQCDLLPAMRRCHARQTGADGAQSIGLGWHVEKMPRDARLIFHGGGTGGYGSLVAFVEENGQPTFGVAVLANAAPGGDGIVANDVAVRVLRLLHEQATLADPQRRN